ncbi:tetratricopeptide repeat protein [Sphingobacterium paucimobilis]|uniref:Tetratricopeptide repeat protein n=1 Tax=Sphingobacterium paucimobilis HER1398 TaxID=1346330 RepID=U2J8W7_9SPHI|nr:hypothetical protein [Sphingobacterium paucimobilis]ERJ61379.1 hypothetical protein M472_21725 [Sphingobacterium paucimobilis HER1398]
MKKNRHFSIERISLAIILAVLTACSSSNEDKADRLNRDGQTEEAIVLYKKAVEEGSIEAISKIALAYSNTHQPEKAKEYYKMAVDKGDKKAAGILANLSLRDEAYDDVITYLKPVVDAGDTTQVYTLGSAYIKLGKYDDAVQVLLKNKNSVYVKAILGTAYYELGDKENAEKYWKSGVYDHKSGGINSYNKLLELYKEQGRTTDYEALEGAY